MDSPTNWLSVTGAILGAGFGLWMCHNANEGCLRTGWLIGALLVITPAVILALPGVIAYALRRKNRTVA